MKHAAVHGHLLGERAVVLNSPPPATLACQRRIWWLADTLRTQGDFIDIVPGMNNLTVILDPARHDGAAVLDQLMALWQQASSAVLPQRRVNIPVHYGGEHGPDLAAVAAHCGLSEQEVIARHSAARYTVFFLGFQPGFAYLGGLPPALATPRRAEPRLAVPAGSVGIGGEQTGIYPATSPGGWQLIGRTTLALFDPQREPPSLLLPGDRVRFVAQEPGHA
ncbi:5-oxoprolinase subunit PxpB [Vogesella sp. LIG4]|uniref:5-oxoprolinase subunit PxpB n=1 Tax=Vogesella sp. LIG4 TaxID=1192162 RepID=UPI00081FAC83|nr:5-oxoprolinase subunit PxpB [Vogesella sp. LIG4]SCK11889.1 sensor histidine kinase inhibitor, KipI family [Vogesella sp. LIG4]